MVEIILKVDKYCNLRVFAVLLRTDRMKSECLCLSMRAGTYVFIGTRREILRDKSTIFLQLHVHIYLN